MSERTIIESDPPPRKCSVCGETDPMPAWFCLNKLALVAEKGKPCSYSREGHERFTKRFKEAVSAPPRPVRGARP